ncbi:MAG: iron ABC transporter permease [Planctomycetota bacterium]|nr:iron ABC transporter permease [Planctomycetota bacterium]
MAFSARTSRTLWHAGLLWSVVAILAAFLLYPIALTVAGGLAKDPSRGLTLHWEHWSSPAKLFADVTLEHVANVFRDPRTLTGLLNSAKIAAFTTILATLLALPLALIAARYRFPFKGLFQTMVLVPMIMPPFVGALGVKAWLGRQGSLNALLGTEWDVLGEAKLVGVVLMQALSLYPIIYLNATAALANLDPALDEAAENLGAGWWRRFFRITLPLVRPGLFAGGTIVFIWSFTELGTPLMFDYYNVTSVQVFYGLKEVENSAEPYALTIVMLAAAVGMYLLGRVLFAGRSYAMYSKASRAGGERDLPAWGRLLALAIFGGVTLLAVLPHLGVVVVAFASPGQWYQTVLPTRWTGAHFNEALGSPEAFGSIVNSLKLSVAAMALDVVLGVVIAYLIVRTSVRGRRLLDALCMLPLAVPGLVLAFGYVAMTLRWPFGKDGPLSGLASVVTSDPNPVLLLIIAYSVRRLPYIVRSAVAGLEQTSVEMEEAAVNLGASRFTAVRRIVVPLIAANLIAGGLLVFSFSMLEVSDSLILAQQSKDYPFTKQIFAFTERLGDGPSIAAAMGVWGMALLATALLAASGVMGKKMGALFRV